MDVANPRDALLMDRVKEEFVQLVEQVKTIENAMAVLVKADRELEANHTANADALVALLRMAEAKEVALTLIDLVRQALARPPSEQLSPAVRCDHSSGWAECHPRVVDLEQVCADTTVASLDQSQACHEEELEQLMSQASEKETELADMRRQGKDMKSECREKQGQLKHVSKMKRRLLRMLRGQSPTKKRPAAAAAAVNSTQAERPRRSSCDSWRQTTAGAPVDELETEEARHARIARLADTRTQVSTDEELAAVGAPDPELNELLASFGAPLVTAISRSLSPAPPKATAQQPVFGRPVLSPAQALTPSQQLYQASVGSPMEGSPTRAVLASPEVQSPPRMGPTRARIRARNARAVVLLKNERCTSPVKPQSRKLSVDLLEPRQ